MPLCEGLLTSAAKAAESEVRSRRWTRGQQRRMGDGSPLQPGWLSAWPAWLLCQPQTVHAFVGGLAEISKQDGSKPGHEYVLLIQALEKGAADAHGEWVPFAARLAQRMASLVQAGSLAVGGPLWALLLEHVLLRLIDSDLQVTGCD